MKKLVCAVLALCFVASLAFAQGTAKAAVKPAAPAPAAAPEAPIAPAIEAITGDIVDNMCASAQKPEMLAEFVKTHTKTCALMPQCETSGYSIYADGKLMKFDSASNAKVAEFLKGADSKLQVVVEAEKAGDELKLVSIKNQ